MEPDAPIPDEPVLSPAEQAANIFAFWKVLTDGGVSPIDATNIVIAKIAAGSF